MSKPTELLLSPVILMKLKINLVKLKMEFSKSNPMLMLGPLMPRWLLLLLNNQLVLVWMPLIGNTIKVVFSVIVENKWIMEFLLLDIRRMLGLLKILGTLFGVKKDILELREEIPVEC